MMHDVKNYTGRMKVDEPKCLLEKTVYLVIKETLDTGPFFEPCSKFGR